MVILDGIPGRVTAIRANVAAGLVRFLRMIPTFTFATHRALITQVGISRNCNFQLQHTLGNIVYVYVFGDRADIVQVSGLAVGGPVSLGNGCNFESGSGIDNLLAYYEQNKLSSKLGNREVEVIVGTTPIRGLLIGMNARLLNPEYQLAAFDLQILGIPEVSTSGVGGRLTAPGVGFGGNVNPVSPPAAVSPTPPAAPVVSIPWGENPDIPPTYGGIVNSGSPGGGLSTSPEF